MLERAFGTPPAIGRNLQPGRRVLANIDVFAFSRTSFASSAHRLRAYRQDGLEYSFTT